MVNCQNRLIIVKAEFVGSPPQLGQHCPLSAGSRNQAKSHPGESCFWCSPRIAADLARNLRADEGGTSNRRGGRCLAEWDEELLSWRWDGLEEGRFTWQKRCLPSQHHLLAVLYCMIVLSAEELLFGRAVSPHPEAQKPRRT